MTQEYILEIAKASLRLRWRKVILICLLFYPFAVIFLRNVETDYLAQIKMFALPQTSKTSLLGGSSSALFAAENSMDRSAFLAGQEILIKSGDVFKAVKQVDPDLNTERNFKTRSKQNIFQFYGKFQELIFGSEYVQTRQKWKNPELNSFKNKITMNVDMESASITINYRHRTPEIAIKSVKTAADALQEINSQILSTQAEKKAAFLSAKIEETRRAVDKSNEAIAQFIRKNKISNDPRTVEPKYRGFATASELITKSTLEIEQLKLSIKESRKVSARLKADLKDGLLEDREGRLTNLMADLRRYEDVLPENRAASNAGAISNLKKQITSVKEKINKELSTRSNMLDRTSLINLLATNESNILEEESSLQAAQMSQEFGRAEMSKYEKELADLPDLGAKLNKLTLVQTQERKILEQLTQRYLEAQIERDTKFTQLYVTEEPMLNDTAKIGKLPILIALLLAITLVVCVFIAGTDLLNGTILDRHQLSQYQHPQYLGAVAYTPELKNRKAFAVSMENGLGLRVAHALKRRLLDSRNNHECTVVAITSNSARAGKTVTVVGLATSMRARGLRPLIIDADYLAKDRALSVQVSMGSNQFISLTELNNLTKGQGTKNFDAKQKLPIFSLAKEFDSEELIHSFLSRGLPDLVKKLKGHYDCVLIDCAPIFVPTMLLVYEQTDALVLCFPEGRATEREVANIVEVVEPSCKENCKIYSALTMAKLRENLVTPSESDGGYYRVNKTAA